MESAKAVELVARRQTSGLPVDDPLRALPPEELGRLLDGLIDSWPSGGISDHLSAELAAAYRRGRPLAVRTPVPGCVCPLCTGIADELPAWTRQTPAHARKMENRAAWEARVDQARGVPLLEVVRILGLGDPVKRGKDFAVRCPLHDDRDPSMSIDVEKGLWYCFPCGEGGDGISLYMKARRQSFSEAVRELAS